MQEDLELLLLKLQKVANDWLDVTKFNDQYNIAQYYDKQIASRLEGTCDWILLHPAYHAWISEELHNKVAKILWIHAPAGHGKSVLCARLVEHLKGIQSNSIAYFFASPHAQSGGTPDFIIRSWIAQMAQLDPDVLELVRQNSGLGQKAPESVVWTLFESIVSVSRNYVFVLDGFDEYTRLDSSRSRFLQKIKKAVCRAACRILITSRNETDIESELSQETVDDPGLIIMRCRITNEDAGHDISLFSKSLVDEKLPKKDDRLRQELAGQLAQKCEGMFLWIKMQQDQLRGGKNAKQLQKIVNNMPAGLMMTYERNWKMIQNQCTEDQTNALAILKWATFGFRPLRVLEIAEALIVDYSEGVTTLRGDDLPDDIDEDYINGELIDICAGLVEARSEDTADDNSGVGAKTIHLIHSSAREFLLSRLLLRPMDVSRPELVSGQPENYAEQHVELATICLAYLSDHDIREEHTECGSVKHKHTFACYAVRYWHSHVSAGGQDNGELLHLMMALFQNDNLGFEHWRRHIESSETRTDGDVKDESDNSQGTPLYYAAFLNLPALMERIWLDDKNQLNQVGGTYGTPLQAACFKGHESVFQLLLTWGANPNVQGGRFGVAINAAIAGDHPSMAQELIRLGTDHTLQDSTGRTPFYTAAKHGDYETAWLLLESGADHVTVNKNGWTPIHAAADEGHIEVVKLLLEKGADITVAEERNGWDPFTSAATNDHIAVVKLLLEKGADIEATSNSGWTALNSAADEGHLEVVKFLLDSGADIENSNSDDWSPLNSAANQGHLAVVKILLENGANMEAASKTGWTAINSAADNGHLEIVELLLNNGANMEAATKAGWRAINSAADSGHLEVVKLLLERGEDIEIATSAGWTPLNSAANQGHLALVKMLIENGANVEAASTKGWTAINSAADSGHLEVVKLLIERGAHIERTNTGGWTSCSC
jgi:ankyrin repeat protein